MPSAAMPPPATPQARPARPAGRWWAMDGVFWVRFLDWGVRRCPFFIEPLLLACYTAVFFGAASRQRRAVVDNLSVLCPEAGWLGRRLRAWRVFWEFAWVMVDGARARSGERHVTWRLDGVDAFREVSDGGGAALLLTAHMGNYDVAGPFFSSKFGRVVHGVRRPERRADLQAYMDRQRQAQAGPSYRVQYNVEGGFLGLELAHALAAGEVVAIQGDRVGDGMGAVEVEWRGRRWPLPSGPLVLAQVASAPVFPVFTLRDGWRSYRILFLPGWPAPRPAASRAERTEIQARLTAWWADTLAGVLQRHWAQWLMFEPAFGAPANDAASAGVAPAPSVHPRDLPAPTSEARPERTTRHGWRPTLQPISRTYLGRFLNTRGLLLPAESPHQLRAEDSAQNWIEVIVLAGFSGLLAAAAVWTALRTMLPTTWAAVGAPVAWMTALHLAPLASGLAADLTRRLPMVPARWSVTRLSEEWLFFGQTGLALGLLATPFRWLGVAWLLFAAANGLCFLLMVAARRSRRPAQGEAP